MNNIGINSFDIGYFDTLASGDSAVHRLDPRAKIITTLLFICAVVSFDRYALLALIPFFIYPVVMITAGGLPIRYIIKKILVISPIAIVIGLFNPIIDRGTIFYVGDLGISGGMVSFLSILLRFILTVSAAMAMVGTTGINAVCDSLIKFGVPKPFVVQLSLFHRYLFVLTDESERMVRARSVRSFGARGMGFGVFVSLIGHLLLRSIGRSERVYCAMRCRGFDGHMRITRTMNIRLKDVVFVLAWALVFVLLRYCNVALNLGEIIMRNFL